DLSVRGPVMHRHEVGPRLGEGDVKASRGAVGYAVQEAPGSRGLERRELGLREGEQVDGAIGRHREVDLQRSSAEDVDLEVDVPAGSRGDLVQAREARGPRTRKQADARQ